jgi:hypothetical protein
MIEVPPQDGSAPRPKRRYPVSAKVRAANRSNLEKANAAPKEKRYRLTPKRIAACRRNLLRLTLRVQALARLFAEVRSASARQLLEAVKETSAEALGNPFRPIDSPTFAAVLGEPAEELQAAQRERETAQPECRRRSRPHWRARPILNGTAHIS